MPLLSSSQFAKEMGIARSTVTKYVKKGIITKALVYQEGRKKPLIDSEKARALLGKNLDPNYTQPDVSIKSEKVPGGAKDQSFIDARTWSERYKAAERKLSFEIKQGKWVLKAEVKDQAFKASRIFRDALMNMPARAAALLASETDERKCHDLLEKECRQILEDIIRELSLI